MREIVIQKGVYGFRTDRGRVQPVPRGATAIVSDEEAVRLVNLGVAAYTDQTSVHPSPSTDSGQAAPNETEVSRLERMSKADLERMAADLGVDISGAKNNRERAQLIVAADDDGEIPNLEADDIVQ